jgi:hypothetical protein
MLELGMAQMILGEFSVAAGTLEHLSRIAPEIASRDLPPGFLRLLRLIAETAEITEGFRAEALPILDRMQQISRATRTYTRFRHFKVARKMLDLCTAPVVASASERWEGVKDVTRERLKTPSVTSTVEPSPSSEEEDLDKGARWGFERVDETMAALRETLHSLQSSRSQYRITVQKAYSLKALKDIDKGMRRAKTAHDARIRRWEAARIGATGISIVAIVLGAALLLNSLLSVFGLGFLQFLKQLDPVRWATIEVPVGIAWFMFGLLVKRVVPLIERRLLEHVRESFVSLVVTKSLHALSVLAYSMWLETAFPFPDSTRDLHELVAIMVSTKKPSITREAAGWQARFKDDIPDAEQAKAMEALLDNEDLPECLILSAALLLARTHSDTAAPQLERSLKMISQSRDLGARALLARMESGQLIDGWLSRMEEPGEERNGRASDLSKEAVGLLTDMIVKALGQIRKRSCTSALLQFMQGEPLNGKTARAVAEALRMQGTEYAVEALGDLAETALTEEEEPAPYLNGLASIGSQQATDRLIGFLHRTMPDSDARNDVVQALARCSHPDAWRPLREGLSSLTPGQAWLVFRNLPMNPLSQTAGRALHDLVSDNTIGLELRWSAVGVLAKAGEPKAETLALALWDESRWHQRDCSVLAAIGSQRTLQALIEVVRTGQDDAAAAARALAGDCDMGLETLAEIVADESARLRGRALASAALAARDRPEANLDLVLQYLGGTSSHDLGGIDVVHVVWFLCYLEFTSGAWKLLDQIESDVSIPQEIRDEAAKWKGTLHKPKGGETSLRQTD